MAPFLRLMMLMMLLLAIGGAATLATEPFLPDRAQEWIRDRQIQFRGAVSPDPVPERFVGLGNEELKRFAVPASYDHLLRNPEIFDGILLQYVAEVDQVLRWEDEAYEVVIDITPSTEPLPDTSSAPVRLLHSTDRGPRLLVGDLIRFSGIGRGLRDTETEPGIKKRLPFISTVLVELVD